MLTLSKEIPGGNFRFISQDGNKIVLEEEQRDSKNPWFYWKFKAVFTEPGEYYFHFMQPNKVGPRSAAVSCDFGKTWNWLSQVPYPDSQNFTFLCNVPGEYWFCQCIPYMQTDFESFVSEYKDNPMLSVSTVGKTTQGRDVELVTIKEGNPGKCIFLTARHHAQESMASYALEGIFREVLSDSDFARKFRKEYTLYAVPFVDKDGVENGDQGKGRIPRDHARDYQGKSFYPEITAIREFLKTINPVFALDMHCPWIRFGSNEYSYMTQHADAVAAIEVERFAEILEKESPDCAPFFKRDILRWGVEWNVRGNTLTSVLPGYGVGGFIQNEMKDCKCSAFSIEIPFANFREKTILPKETRLFGKSIIHSVSKYIDTLAEEEKKNAGVRQAVLCFSKVLMPDGNENEFRKMKEDLACQDYKVGFLDDICNQLTNEEKLKSQAESGFQFLSTAGSHSLDCGYEGLYRSLYILESCGMIHSGTARSLEEHEKVRLVEVNGIRISFTSYTVPFEACRQLTHEQSAFAVNVLSNDESYRELSDNIRSARNQGSDFAIVLLDFSGHSKEAADSIVRKVMNLGADLVVGNNPPIGSKDEDSVVTIVLRKENGKTIPAGGFSIA